MSDLTDQVAYLVREACVRAALEAYEHAGLGGLCAEGRWELAVDAMRSLDLDGVVQGHGTEIPAERTMDTLSGVPHGGALRNEFQ